MVDANLDILYVLTHTLLQSCEWARLVWNGHQQAEPVACRSSHFPSLTYEPRLVPSGVFAKGVKPSHTGL